MTQAALIEALTDICIRQADIIKDQAAALAQLGAQVREDDILSSRAALQELVGELA